MPRPILIMLGGDVPEKLIGKTGNFDVMFLRMADFSGIGAVVKDVSKGEDLGDAAAYSGIIIPGSPAMVTDKAPWMVASGEWLYRAMNAGCKIFGVCYGHQLMGQAFGGTADYMPYRMELGTHMITPRADMPRHPLLPALPGPFKANLLHSQAVTKLPPGATVLAGNDNDPHQIISYGPNAVSVQFHPEFDRAVTQCYIDLIAGTDDPETRAKEKGIQLGAPAEDTPVAASILQHFVKCCREC